MDELLARVPKKLHDRFRDIVALTDAFCQAHLNEEYRDLCRACAADACAAKVPVTSGKPAGWAAGVVHSVAFANFLTSDPSRPHHMSPADLAKRAGVSVATMQNKAKAIRDALNIIRMDGRYCTAELNAQNPLNELMEMFSQMMATTPARPRPKKKKRAKPSGPPRVYALEVFILSGPITRAFAKKNRSISRVIEIRGDQTLEDLHWAIFDAFDRDDPHMYEFQFGKKPMDPNGPRYVMPEAGDDGFGPPAAGYTDDTTIDDLNLTTKSQFGYWFDFGDDWQHQINVVGITEGEPKGRFPRITKRTGESPPQYIDWDEE